MEFFRVVGDKNSRKLVKAFCRQCRLEGISDPDGASMTPETPYFIASITKLFTAKKEVIADAQ